MKPALFKNGQPSDGSGSKFFDPDRVGSIFCGLGWVGSGQPLIVWVWIWKIFHFFSLRVKKISLGRVEKYPGQRRVSILFLRVKSKLGSGHFLCINKGQDTFFRGNTGLFWLGFGALWCFLQTQSQRSVPGIEPLTVWSLRSS